MNRMEGCTGGEIAVVGVMVAILLFVVVVSCYVIWGQDRDR